MPHSIQGPNLLTILTTQPPTVEYSIYHIYTTYHHHSLVLRPFNCLGHLLCRYDFRSGLSVLGNTPHGPLSTLILRRDFQPTHLARHHVDLEAR